MAGHKIKLPKNFKIKGHVVERIPGFGLNASQRIAEKKKPKRRYVRAPG